MVAVRLTFARPSAPSPRPTTVGEGRSAGTGLRDELKAAQQLAERTHAQRQAALERAAAAQSSAKIRDTRLGISEQRLAEALEAPAQLWATPTPAGVGARRPAA